MIGTAFLEKQQFARGLGFAQGKPQAQQIAVKGDCTLGIARGHADMLKTQQRAHLSSSTIRAKSSGSAMVYLICPMAKAELTSVRLILPISRL